MKRTVLALATAVTIGMTALAAPSPAEARWRGGGWGPGIAGGLIGAAVIGGIASSAYAYGPSYGYYGGYPAYGYGGYAPPITTGMPPRITAATQATPRSITVPGTGALFGQHTRITAALDIIAGIIVDTATIGEVSMGRVAV